ncbi:MAG: YciI family protein [Bacteroidota bacterium]
MVSAQEFMMIFRYDPQADQQPSQDVLAAQPQRWSSFIGNLAIQEKLVSTHQLGYEGKQLSATLTVAEGVRFAEKETISGNMVVKANSMDEVLNMAKECPILDLGGRVEIRSIIPMS